MGAQGTGSEARSVERRFHLSARVSSDRPAAVRPVLDEWFPSGAVVARGDEFFVEADLTGPTAKDLNRRLLSQLRRAEKRTRLRARWVAPDGTESSFFDYVLKTVHRP